MNKTLNINLGGVAFIIDEDAYVLLDNYLTAIHNHFRNSEGYEEITNDIEARMGELFTALLQGRIIINAKDVASATQTMGTLEDFGAEPVVENQQRTYAPHTTFKTGRRVFRDPEDKVLGGVCSGLSAYFGINDPIWFRIIFILLVFAGGSGVIFYLIMWIIVPKAMTTADRLAMRGESINVNNIAKEVQDGMRSLGDKFQDSFGDQKKNRFSNVNTPYRASGFSSFLNEVMDALKYILPKAIKFIAILFAVFICVTIVVSGIALLGKSMMTGNYLDYMLGRDLVSSNWFFFLNVALFFILPAIILLTLAIKIIFKLKNTRNVIQGAALLWFIALVLALITGFRLVHSIQNYSEKSNTKQFFTSVPIDTLTLDAQDEQNFDDFDHDWVQFGDFKLKNNVLYTDDIRVKVLKSDKPEVYWEIDYGSNGISQEEANELASAINYEITQDGKRLILPRYFIIPKGKVWRNQRVRVTIYVPEGKHLIVTDRADRFVNKLELDPKEDEGWYDFSEDIWKMGNQGFINTSPKRQEDEDREEDDERDRYRDRENNIDIIIKKDTIRI